MSRLDDLVADVARARRRVDRVYTLLGLAERALRHAVDELDASLKEACNGAPTPRPRRKSAGKVARIPEGNQRGENAGTKPRDKGAA